MLVNNWTGHIFAKLRAVFPRMFLWLMFPPALINTWTNESFSFLVKKKNVKSGLLVHQNCPPEGISSAGNSDIHHLYSILSFPTNTYRRTCYYLSSLELIISKTKFCDTEIEIFLRRNSLNPNPPKIGKSLETEKFRNRNVNLCF